MRESRETAIRNEQCWEYPRNVVPEVVLPFSEQIKFRALLRVLQYLPTSSLYERLYRMGSLTSGVLLKQDWSSYVENVVVCVAIVVVNSDTGRRHSMQCLLQQPLMALDVRR